MSALKLNFQYQASLWPNNDSSKKGPSIQNIHVGCQIGPLINFQYHSFTIKLVSWNILYEMGEIVSLQSSMQLYSKNHNGNQGKMNGLHKMHFNIRQKQEQESLQLYFLEIGNQEFTNFHDKFYNYSIFLVLDRKTPKNLPLQFIRQLEKQRHIQILTSSEKQQPDKVKIILMSNTPLYSDSRLQTVINKPTIELRKSIYDTRQKIFMNTSQYVIDQET
ncbi:unnamed protein product [Paramecium primaurelia]|uniref:Uncharacterized protein n=1 Tax=Paramecium primaurelia TaxID=5886 RepID=A0A8S1MIE3_PARPR|nr:unnamed protein product [Paramecium primaurelia]